MPGLLLPTASNVRPSYKTGFARSAAESAYPGLWDSLLGAWCSSLGPTGDTLHNVVHPGEDGVFTNMDPATDWTVSGDQGWVINSEDASEYVAITSPTLDNLVTVSGFTASVWVRVDALHGASNAEATIFAKTVGGVWYSAWALIIDSDNLYWNISTTQPATESCNEAGFSAKHLGKWIHVVGVHDQLDSSSDQRLYVNGVEVGENYSAPSPSKNGSGLITLGGSEPLSTRFTLDGATANAMVWDRPLQPSEIRQLYRDPLAPFRQRRFTPTISGAAEEVAGWQPYWAPRMTQRIIGSGVR